MYKIKIEICWSLSTRDERTDLLSHALICREDSHERFHGELTEGDHGGRGGGYDQHGQDQAEESGGHVVGY